MNRPLIINEWFALVLVYVKVMRLTFKYVLHCLNIQQYNQDKSNTEMCCSLLILYTGGYISWLDSLPDKQEVIGSSPIPPTKKMKIF